MDIKINHTVTVDVSDVLSALGINIVAAYMDGSTFILEVPGHLVIQYQNDPHPIAGLRLRTTARVLGYDIEYLENDEWGMTRKR
jgi:hypothetical protein